jgi:hypothetical protein
MKIPKVQYYMYYIKLYKPHDYPMLQTCSIMNFIYTAADKCCRNHTLSFLKKDKKKQQQNLQHYRFFTNISDR